MTAANDMHLQEVIDTIEPIDPDWIEKARRHTAQLLMPTRALGRLHDISERLCGIGRTLNPAVGRKAVLVMAGDHGVVDKGVSAYPQEVTVGMVQTFVAGGAGINAIARLVGAEVRVVDMGVKGDIVIEDPEKRRLLRTVKIGRGTRDFTEGPAMSRHDAESAVMAGFVQASELVGEGVEVLGTGDMGIGNTTPSAAIGAVITGADLDTMVGPGTGVDAEGLARKKEVVARGIRVNTPDRNDGLDVLAKVGGFEIGGIAGVILAAAFHRRPVVVDGFISTAGALVACALCPAARDYLFAGHRSEEPGHAAMLRHLGLDPILNLGMRLGEGTGGALAMNILEAAARVFGEVMTFEQAGVPGKE